ncbi:hypothetical protein QO010_003356 [Caulobacter ginsengisoli]|uniref:Uncharacterized protein n=1 Tax=Caulobacter ginsengisoli TaxID=400775 RepID=A0ABU0IU81_9CAUL|nr:hypothetical protein [Caulobacter ginsengisoli]MDQ0465567.1 hypothetical protein [Caulobacter ginsengisoli]
MSKQKGGRSDSTNARAKLRAEIKRTGVTVLALLKDAPGLRADLTPRLINRWLSGLSKEIDPGHADLVLTLYRALPDATPVTGRPVSSKKQPLTTDMRRGLEAELIRTCATVASLVEGSNLPPGLNARVVRSWVYGEAKSVAPAHWTYVLGRLATTPTATGLVFTTRERSRLETTCDK